jgi:hypothetical protein
MAAKLGAGVEAISDDEARPGGGSAFADALVDIWRAVREGRLATVTDEVRRVLGRAPKSFDLWVEENADAFKRSTKRRGSRARSAPPLPSRSRAK